MIKKVVLKNWRSHLFSEFEFSKGTNALLGHLGSGKTSVLDAICFALFGTFPHLQTRKVKLDDVIMRKPEPKQRAEIELIFEVNGKEYYVKRIVERRKGTVYSELRENGKLLEAPSSSRVTELIQNILKVDYELFFRAIYSEQNQLDFFLSIPKGKRMKKIDELLGIDKFEEARKNCVTLANRLTERKIGKEDFLRIVNLEEMEKELKEVKESILKIEREIKTLEKQIEQNRKERERIENELGQLKSIKEKIENLEKDERELVTLIKSLEKSIEELRKGIKELSYEDVKKLFSETDKILKDKKKEKEQLETIYNSLKEKKSKILGELSMVNKRIEELKDEIEEKKKIEEQIETLEKKFGKIDELVKEKKEVLEKTKEKINSLQERLKILQESVIRLKESEKRCPTCDTPLPEDKRRNLIQSKEREISSKKEILENLLKKEKELKDDLELLQKKSEELKTFKIKLEKFAGLDEELKRILKLAEERGKELEAIKKEIEKTEEEIKRLEEHILEKERELKDLEFVLKTFELIEKKEKELVDSRKKLMEIRSFIDSLRKKIEGRNVEELERRFYDLSLKVKEDETKKESLTQMLEEKKKRNEELAFKINQYKKEKKEIEKLEKLIKDLKILEKGLQITQEELRKRFVSAVNAAMERIWESIYPYRDFIGIRLNVEGGDYVLQLQERSGKFINVEGIASGGERSLACLALRIAFSLVLAPHLRILVLDEPTHNLDRKAIKDFARTLRENIHEFIDQVFLITHNPELEEAITGFAYRLERDKSRDEPTRVIRII